MKTMFALALPVALASLLALATDQAVAQTKTTTPGKTGTAAVCPFDDDGDGIPNRTDPDHIRPRDGSGHKFGKGHGKMQRGSGGNGPRLGNGVCDGTGPKGCGGRH